MKRRVRMIVCFVLGLLVVIPFGTAVFLHEQNFGERFTTYGPLSRSLHEFAGLKRQKFTFTS